MFTRIHPERIPAASYVPTAGCDLANLTNDELIAGTRRLVGTSNQVFAMLLAHLAEVEARGLHRERACSSLYTYCIYELRFSEDAAFRRVGAARLVKRFPVLYGAIASGELHLTGLLMLGPHLTPENHVEVLGRAKHRTKKELTKLLRTIDPLPDLPARIEPLGPALARPATRKPAWSDFVESLCPPVRELMPGDAPRDWVGDLREVAAAIAESSNDGQPAESAIDGQPAESAIDGRDGPAPARPATFGPTLAGVEPLGPAPARSGVTTVTGPQRYGVQFSAQEEYVQLVERAKALLSHAHSKSSLEDIHLRAMRLLVADLEKRRFAMTPRAGRHIPAALKRTVYERDEARCSYVDVTGQRCREAHRLELHHLVPFARGGMHTPENLTLRCKAHNALAAEQDFGRECVENAKESRRHESFAAEGQRG